MNEQFLHYVWKYQKFNYSDLQTIDGDSLHIFQPGSHNHNAGPDFSEARVKIGEIEWAGNVEIHTRASDWNIHGHQHDAAYDSVVLHVVWQADELILQNGMVVPTLELKDRIDPELIKNHKSLINQVTDIACATPILEMDQVTITSMISNAAIERFEGKGRNSFNKVSDNMGWEEACYQSIGSTYGLKVNVENFIVLLGQTPLKILRKYAHNLKMVEAILFGQAGFLEKPVDDYQKELKDQYEFVMHKHNLSRPLERFQWKFGRLRPASFPTIRIAQMASLLHQTPALFQKILSIDDYAEIRKLIKVRQSQYWLDHFDFGKPSEKTYLIGDQFVGILIINALVPMLVAYGKYMGEQQWIDKAIRWLEVLPPENNKITRLWKTHQIQPENAFDSQGLIHRYNEYCIKRRCLQCEVGVKIIHA